MTDYTVLRFEKLKSWGAVGGAKSHNGRLRETLNADPEALAKNRFLVGIPSDDVIAICKARLGKQKIRKNAVYAVEGIMSASPQYFRPNNPEQYGHYDPDRLEAWVDASMKWLLKKFGNRVISAVLHMDEATPHIQFLILPLDDKGKLNCRKLFGGSRQVMSDIQTDYGKAVAHLGITRGRKGSKAKHKEVSEYYTATQNLDKTPPLALPAQEDIEVPEPPGPIARIKDKNLIDYAMGTATKAVEARTARLAPIFEDLAKRNGMLTAEVIRVTAENEELKDTTARLNRTNAAFKAEAKKMRDLPLDKILIVMFGAAERQDSTPQSRCFEMPDGSAIGFSAGQWQELPQGAHGKGAINLVMHLSGYDQGQYQQAVRDMADHFSEEETIASLTHQMVEEVPQMFREMSKGEFQLPPASEQNWQVVRTKLTAELRLPDWLIDEAHERGLIYSDRRWNCVFPRADDAGAFIQNLWGTPFVRNVGQQSVPYVLLGTDSNVFITDTPLDALALKALYPDSTILATGGFLPPEKLQPWLDGREDIFLAQGHAEHGQEYAGHLVESYPQARRTWPDQGQDWLECWRLQIDEDKDPIEPSSIPSSGMGM